MPNSYFLIPGYGAQGGKAEDIAEVAVFLAKQAYITGQVIHVDGGMVM